jgi:excisionase family DNA binding protein
MTEVDDTSLTVSRGDSTMPHQTTVDHDAGVMLGMRRTVKERIEDSQEGPRTAQTMQHGSRLTLTIPEACHALGIGETMLRQMMRTGQLPILKIGRRVLIPRQAVEQLVAEACGGRSGNSALSAILR